MILTMQFDGSTINCSLSFHSMILIDIHMSFYVQSQLNLTLY